MTKDTASGCRKKTSSTQAPSSHCHGDHCVRTKNASPPFSPLWSYIVSLHQCRNIFCKLSKISKILPACFWTGSSACGVPRMSDLIIVYSRLSMDGQTRLTSIKTDQRSRQFENLVVTCKESRRGYRRLPSSSSCSCSSSSSSCHFF